MTEEFKAAQERRRKRQIITASLFPIILVGGWFYPFLGYFIPFCMLLGLGSSFFWGRKWCDWLCPRGSFYDIVIKPVSPKKEIPKVLKSMSFRLGIFIFLMTVMAINLVMRWFDPEKIGKFFVILLTFTTCLGIILALIFHQRSWCAFCPIGSMINWLGSKKLPLKIDSKLCIACQACDKACPIQIHPSKYKKEGLQTVKDNDCLKCGLCILACPQKALSRSRQ